MNAFSTGGKGKEAMGGPREGEKKRKREFFHPNPPKEREKNKRKWGSSFISPNRPILSGKNTGEDFP